MEEAGEQVWGVWSWVAGGGGNLDGDQWPADHDDSHCLRSRHAPGTSSYVPHTARAVNGKFHSTQRDQLGLMIFVDKHQFQI